MRVTALVAAVGLLVAACSDTGDDDQADVDQHIPSAVSPSAEVGARTTVALVVIVQPCVVTASPGTTERTCYDTVVRSSREPVDFAGVLWSVYAELPDDGFRTLLGEGEHRLTAEAVVLDEDRLDVRLPEGLPGFVAEPASYG